MAIGVPALAGARDGAASHGLVRHRCRAPSVPLCRSLTTLFCGMPGGDIEGQSMSLFGAFRQRKPVSEGVPSRSGDTVFSPPGDEPALPVSAAEPALADFSITGDVWPVLLLSVVAGACQPGMRARRPWPQFGSLCCLWRPAAGRGVNYFAWGVSVVVSPVRRMSRPRSSSAAPS
jgi:hypothetical protein